MLAGTECFCIVFRTVECILNIPEHCEQQLLFSLDFQSCGAYCIYRTQ
jgi:hypothetical protein